MALAMPSRFAVLKIEDDDFKPVNTNKSKDKKKNDQKQTGKKVENKQVPNKKPSKVKQQPTKQQTQQKKDKKKKVSADQWEQWKQKDNELVDETFERDLHNAILQSKLNYEEKKDTYKSQKKEKEPEKKQNETQNKKKKNKAMSLGQFNNLVSTNSETHAKDEDSDTSQKTSEDNEFFERIKQKTKEELNKELNKTSSKEAKKDRKSFNNDTITIAHLQEKLEALKQENAKLKLDYENAKKETITVKTRNKTLCGILASGEMKDKADILMELDKLSRVRDELTEEVTRLHGLLEQERSKVGALTAEPHPHNHNHNKHKEKNKKRSGSENVQP